MMLCSLSVHPSRPFLEKTLREHSGVHVLVGRAALQTEFKSWAVMGFSIAHQSLPAIFFVCVAMEGGHTCKGSISSNVLCKGSIENLDGCSLKSTEYINCLKNYTCPSETL